MKFKQLKKKVIKIGVIIVLGVFVFNTGFYALLKSSNFNEIIFTYIQKNKNKNFSDTLGNIHSINYRYFGMKKYSWTGRRTTITFDIKVNTSNSICIMKVVLEKHNNTWIVSNIEKKYSGD